MRTKEKQKVNPMCLFNIQRLEVLPPFFESTTVRACLPQQARGRAVDFSHTVRNWIEQNLKGRYYAELLTCNVSEENSQYSVRGSEFLHVGFEDPKEMSLFILSCPHLTVT